MPNVSWTSPGTSGNWSSTANWTGLVGESYPGQLAVAGDLVTIGGTNSSYVVTFDVSSATISSLDIEGGNSGSQATTLRMTAGDTLNIQGGVTFLKKGSPAALDGAGIVSVAAGITAAGAPPTTEGLITAGTGTTGGVLELTGAGFITTPFTFAIATAARTTLEFNLAGGVTSSAAITINNSNQTLEIGSQGTLAIGAAQNVTNGTILIAGGNLTDTSGLSFGTQKSNGSLSGSGTVTGALTRSGTGTADSLTATGGTLTLSTAIGANSGLVFAIDSTAGSDLQLNADPGNGNSFTFLGSTGELALTSSAASGFNDSIVGLNVASTLTPTNLVDILGDPTVTVASGKFGSGTTGTVTLSDGAVLNLSGITNASGNWLVSTAPDSGGTGTDIFLSGAACYARGTMIGTPDGERAVETLRSGERVITLVNDDKVPGTVRWLGHRRIDLTRHPRSETLAPIRVERDAFADNVPHRDLLLSPDHAVFVDGKLICVRQLVNGFTIRNERGWTSVDYYHVELDRHGILLAEGLPAESYLDTGNRGFFANSDSPLVLHPDLPNENGLPTRETGSCAPFVTDGAKVRPVWQRLARRAATLGRPVPSRATTTDAGPWLECSGGRRVEPIHRDGDRIIFVLSHDASGVRLVSRAQVPAEARPWLSDPRRLGLRVKRIALRGVVETREVAMDHPDFARGWWEIEHDGPVMSRWTDGAAVLPLPPMRGPAMLEIHLAGAMTYAVDGTPEDATDRRAA